MVRRFGAGKVILLILSMGIFLPLNNPAESSLAFGNHVTLLETTSNKTLYGQASYYAQKFQGRKTANGEIFDHGKLTAACNVLPLGTWLKVTNLRNNKSIMVKTNDRLHPKTRRILDLTHVGAQKLGFVHDGLARVKIEVLPKK